MLNNTTLKIFLSLCFILLLNACGGRSDSTSFFILDSGEVTPVLAINDLNENEIIKIQLRAVDLPKYLDRNSIVTRDQGGVLLDISSFNSWAENLDDGSKRVIAEVLTPLFLEKGVLLQPLDDDSFEHWKIFIQIQRFDGTLGSDAVLDARWTVRNHRDVTLISGAFVDKTSAGSSYSSLVQAQSNLLKKLATSMVEPIVSAVKENF